jgi:anti-sigma factor RsiW
VNGKKERNEGNFFPITVFTINNEAMKEPADNQMKELGWRQRLAPAEEQALQAHLAARPEARADWEMDLRLNALLDKLPEAPPVASNFTALVMQAVEREAAVDARASRTPPWGWFSARKWIPRLAAACVIVGMGVLAVHQHQIAERRIMAENVARLAEAYSAAGPASVRDFDSISRLAAESPAKPDTKLLALMQ